MPEEVAALGDPEAVYPPDEKQVALNRRLVHILGGSIAAGLIAVAGFLMCCDLFQPSWVTNQPQFGVLLAVGAGLFALAVLLFGAAMWSTDSAFARDRWGPRTYLVYPDVLAEVFPTGHRLIPLGKIRDAEKHPVFSHYHCTVDGEKPLHFDSTVRDHARFAELIQARAAERRFLDASGGASVVAEARDGRVGPSLLALERKLKGNAYRIFVLGDRLLFYRVAAPVLGVSPTCPRSPLVGGLVFAVLTWNYKKARAEFVKEMEELDRADASELLDRAARNDGSFVASPGDFEQVELNPRSTFEKAMGGGDRISPAAVLKLVDSRRGSRSLALVTHGDVLSVLEQWPSLLGTALEVNVVWSPAAGGFVAKR
jgi:hypothetical protein